jgi:hypothetical protein
VSNSSAFARAIIAAGLGAESGAGIAGFAATCWACTAVIETASKNAVTNARIRYFS